MGGGTLISWNIPNMITVPLMVFVTFLIAALVWQFIRPMLPNSGGSTQGGGGF